MASDTIPDVPTTAKAEVTSVVPSEDANLATPVPPVESTASGANANANPNTEPTSTSTAASSKPAHKEHGISGIFKSLKEKLVPHKDTTHTQHPEGPLAEARVPAESSGLGGAH